MLLCLPFILTTPHFTRHTLQSRAICTPLTEIDVYHALVVQPLFMFLILPKSLVTFRGSKHLLRSPSCLSPSQFLSRCEGTYPQVIHRVATCQQSLALLSA